MNGDNHFFYLNRDNRWPDFRWPGLELRQDGALQLDSLPLLAGGTPASVTALSSPDGPAGIAIIPDRTIFISDPVNHRLLRLDACDQKLSPVPCLGGEGGLPTQFRQPRGLLFHPGRRALLVADSGNHRIQLFDPATLQLLDSWGQPKRGTEPRPGDAPGRFNTPWSLVMDPDGDVYVVDYGNRGIQKFNVRGEVIEGFWDYGRKLVTAPRAIAVAGEEASQVYVLDAVTQKIFVFGIDGQPIADANSKPVAFTSPLLQQPLALLAAGDAVYLGDNGQRRLFTFKQRDGRWQLVGAAVGYEGPVAALALDSQGGGLRLHTGAADAPLQLAVGQGYRGKGVLWSQAIEAGSYKVGWYRLKATMDPPAADGRAHWQFFLATAADKPEAPLVEVDTAEPFADSHWRTLPLDGKDLFIGGEPAGYLWIGALFSGDSTASPVLHQLRVEFDQPTYLRHLPAIYRDNAQSRAFLTPLLALFESQFTEAETATSELPVLFDPAATPHEYLSWLAGWLALELDEDWGEEKQRQVITSAFELLYDKQGTAAGLRLALEWFAGVHAVIEEPLLSAAWWSLPAAAPAETAGSQSGEYSVLGITTMLAPAQPQGAVLGSSATLDRSHLITNEEFGAPLFTDSAHQFSVLIHRSELHDPATLARVRAVIEREKPAHTDYQIGIIEPRMRVGLQARLGIDTVVAGPAPALPLGDNSRVGQGTVLGGSPGGRVGERSQIGLSMRVG